MYGKVIQIMECRDCHLRHLYPACTACDVKAHLDHVDRRLWKGLWTSLFSPTPLLQSREYKYPSRWREEWRVHGKVIRVPLFYG